ncbi:hypothetical protein GCM10010329_39480 [Streptomyces spiroverticillatus]|uniref:VOC domain-containing protein n=1 Tax=Streptomyces finlayi TaxID=67296 RepID=A0A918WZH7_9ACTN|nr:hypothetical protein GCM10010329_39480 [Streptomyces spiroverticillatus]GHC98337.1 hypothetical protein GCM10010334_40760 [Streptomyces finlayi]
MGPGYGSGWTVYLAAKDLARVQRRAEEHGARFTVSGVPAGVNGRLSLGVDPQGAAFGLWEGHHDEGVVLVDEPGALVDAELHSSDTAAQEAFYQGVFDAPCAAEPHPVTRWVPVFGVLDRTAFEDRARAAGGRVLASGLIGDPWGAVFGVRTAVASGT